MNFLDGTIEANGAGRPFQRGRASSIRCPMRCRRHSRAGGHAGRARRACVVEPTARTRGTVRLTEPLGDATLVHFDYGQGRPLVAKVPPTSLLASGDALAFRFAPEHLHLFDRESGARLH